MDELIADCGIDALIYRVSQKAGISDAAASVAVDEVLTTVKEAMPSSMAGRLVKVVAGEERFDDWPSRLERAYRWCRSTAERLAEHAAAQLTRRAEHTAVKSAAPITARLTGIGRGLRQQWSRLSSRLRRP